MNEIELQKRRKALRNKLLADLKRRGVKTRSQDSVTQIPTYIFDGGNIGGIKYN